MTDPTPILALVYMSDATRPMDDDELKTLLDVSRTNNARDGITGILLFRKRLFLQVLEGEPTAVERTYARIGRDARHSRVTLLHRGLRPARAFAQWSMGFHRVPVDGELALPDGFTEYLDRGTTPDAMPDAAFLFGYLERFRNITG